MVKCNMPVSQRIIWFRGGDLSVIFCHLDQDTVDKAVFP